MASSGVPRGEACEAGHADGDVVAGKSSRDGMTDFVAHISRRRTVLLVLFAGMVVVVGMWLAGLLEPLPPSSPGIRVFLVSTGWVAILFFGLSAVINVKRLFERGEQLRIGPAGIYSKPWSEQTISWAEVANVTIWTMSGQSNIVLHLRDRSRFPGKKLPAMFAGLTRRLSGGDVGISMTGTDRSLAEALAAIGRFRPHGG